MTEQGSINKESFDEEGQTQAIDQKEEFWGGLTEEGERLAGHLKVILERQGYDLKAGTRIPQSVIREALESLKITSDFWMAMVAPFLLKNASGGLEAHWDLEDGKGVYNLE